MPISLRRSSLQLLIRSARAGKRYAVLFSTLPLHDTDSRTLHEACALFRHFDGYKWLPDAGSGCHGCREGTGSRAMFTSSSLEVQAEWNDGIMPLDTLIESFSGGRETWFTSLHRRVTTEYDLRLCMRRPFAKCDWFSAAFGSGVHFQTRACVAEGDIQYSIRRGRQ